MEPQEKKRLTAQQSRALKLALDAIMLILLVLMYKKQVISMEFHEIGGLALIGLFLIHHLVNAKWIGAVTRRKVDQNGTLSEAETDSNSPSSCFRLVSAVMCPTV